MTDTNDSEKRQQGDSIHLTFCIPIYNVKPYLERLVRSIVLQDLSDFSYEMVFVDDCSTDGSFEHLFDITKGYENVRILKNDKNSGISYTRNRLVDNAAGEYLWFVDSDDMVYPGAARVLLEIAQAKRADVVLANYVKVAEDADALEKGDIGDISYKQVNTKNWDWLPDMNNECRMLSMCRGIFKKDFLRAHDLRFNESVIMKEDALLYYEFSMADPLVVKCEFPCYCVRQRRSSAMHGIDEIKAKKYFHSSLALADAYQRHIENKNYHDINKVVELVEEEKEQLVKFLLHLSDTKYVREQLKLLRSKGWYPYKVKKRRVTNIYQVVDQLLPIPICFWVFYYLFRAKR